MTPTLLENEKVREFFGCHCRPEANIMGEHHKTNCSDAAMALRVIAAMSKEIKKGDKCLGWVNGDTWREEDAADDYGNFHPTLLPLPHQPQRPTSVCACGTLFQHHSPERCWNDNRPPAEKCYICDSLPQKFGPGEINPICEAHLKEITKKCFCGGDDQSGHNPTMGHTEHKPSPTPPEPKEKCKGCSKPILHWGDTVNDGASCVGGMCLPEPRGEFGDDLEEKIRKIWVSCTQDEGVKRLLELLRLSQAGKGSK